MFCSALLQGYVAVLFPALYVIVFLILRKGFHAEASCSVTGLRRYLFSALSVVTFLILENFLLTNSSAQSNRLAGSVGCGCLGFILFFGKCACFRDYL